MTQFRFDIDTTGVPQPDGTIAVNLHPEWNVDGRILNGGYLQAAVVRAAQVALSATVDVAAGADAVDAVAAAAVAAAAVPIAVSTTFAAVASPGPATVTVRVLRAGSRVTAAHAELHQQGATAVSCLITFVSGFPSSGYDAEPARDSSYPVMPKVTGAPLSIRVPADQLPGTPGLAGLIDYAFVPESSAWLTGDTSAGPRIRCWLAFADGRPVDTLAAIAMVDIAPPVCFALGNFGWAPTLQLQVGLFAEPAPGPLLLDLVGSPYGGAIVAEDALLWDCAGTLVARSRQIALAPRR